MEGGTLGWLTWFAGCFFQMSNNFFDSTFEASAAIFAGFRGAGKVAIF